MDDETTDPTGGAEAVVIQLLRVLSDVDLEALGEDLRHLDTATTQRAMTGASLLAEAITRATLGSETVAGALGVDFSERPTHVPHRERGLHIEIHDDEAAPATDTASEA